MTYEELVSHHLHRLVTVAQRGALPSRLFRRFVSEAALVLYLLVRDRESLKNDSDVAWLVEWVATNVRHDKLLARIALLPQGSLSYEASASVYLSLGGWPAPRFDDAIAYAVNSGWTLQGERLPSGTARLWWICDQLGFEPNPYAFSKELASALALHQRPHPAVASVEDLYHFTHGAAYLSDFGRRDVDGVDDLGPYLEASAAAMIGIGELDVAVELVACAHWLRPALSDVLQSTGVTAPEPVDPYATVLHPDFRAPWVEYHYSVAALLLLAAVPRGVVEHGAWVDIFDLRAQVLSQRPRAPSTEDFVLAGRCLALCRSGHLDEALDLLETTPLATGAATCLAAEYLSFAKALVDPTRRQ